MVRPEVRSTVSVRFRGAGAANESMLHIYSAYLIVLYEYCVCGTTHALRIIRCICTESAEQI